MKNKILEKILNKDGSLVWKYSKSQFIQKYFSKEELEFLKNSFGKTYSEKYWCLAHNITENPKCPICGNNLKFNSFKEGGYQKYCSNSCTLKGRDYKEEWNEKRKETNQKRYGVNSTFELVNKEKRKESIRKKYGGNSPFSSKEIQEKSKNTQIKKYGSIENKYKHIKEKANGLLHGNPETSKKIKQTCLQKYGKENPNQTKEAKQKQSYRMKNGQAKKMLEAQVKKYGDYYINTPNGIKNKIHRYYYNGEKFDSSWELAFWIYHKDHNIPIIHNHKKLFFYEFEGKRRGLIPDFIVNNQIIEIKGDHFKKNLEWNKVWPFKEKCYLKNNVKLFFNEDMKIYLDYIKEKYGPKYLKNFKKHIETDYKRKINKINSIEELFILRNKNEKVEYACKECNSQVITSISNAIHFSDLLCKICRKKNT